MWNENIKLIFEMKIWGSIASEYSKLNIICIINAYNTAAKLIKNNIVAKIIFTLSFILPPTFQ